MARQINQAGLDLLKSSEGCSLTAYKDGGGVWTIGYGTTGSEVSPGLKITQKQADDFLKADLSVFCEAIDDLVHVPLTDNQFSALVVFVYNVGINAFSKSTLRALLNNGGYEDAANQLVRWSKDNGKTIPGLLARREREKALFKT